MKYWKNHTQPIFVVMRDTFLNIEGIQIPIRQNDVFVESGDQFEWLNMMDEHNEDVIAAIQDGLVNASELMQNPDIQLQVSHCSQTTNVYDFFGGAIVCTLN